jgi:hypothetical protein
VSRKHREQYRSSRPENLEDEIPKEAIPVVPNQPEERPALSEMQAASDSDGDMSGLRCRRCGCGNFRVDYTRPKENSIMRRRLCRACGFPMLTYERVAGAGS